MFESMPNFSQKLVLEKLRKWDKIKNYSNIYKELCQSDLGGIQIQILRNARPEEIRNTSPAR